MNITHQRQVEAAIRRWNERQKERERNLRLIAEGHPLEADSPARVEKFLTRRGFSATDTTAIMRHAGKGFPASIELGLGRPDPNALERMLGTNDLVGVAFFERGLQVARTVGRIWIGVSAGRPMGYGTGFMVSPRLLMTNHHVLGDKAIARTSVVEFDYQVSVTGALLQTTNFSIDPDTFFFADEHLDYAIVAVRETAQHGGLSEYGWNPLIEEEGKAIISQWVNIIQHPNGEAKQLGLRENQLIDVLPEFVHYRTDTAPGSSGSPVLNDRWEVVGLHHSGVWRTNAAGQALAMDGQVWRPEMGDHRIDWIANEGIRISTIIKHLRGRTMTTAERQLFDAVFTVPAEPRREVGQSSPMPAAGSAASKVSVSSDGTATWTIPLSVSINLGGFPAPTTPQTATQLLPLTPTSAPGPAVSGAPTDQARTLAEARAEFLKRADVLGVRLGYVFENGWITKKPAIVVSVRQKRPPAELREAGISPLPISFQGMPVEVTGPTVEELVAAERGPALAEALLNPAPVTPEEITYVRPTGVRLDRVERQRMRVVAHVSPDAGWTQLSTFLGATTRKLIVGMYDFGAPHVVAAVKSAGSQRGFRNLTLVMQPGESVGTGTKADDLEDAVTVTELSDALGRKFQNAWVKIGSVRGWVASSYHIKVAVRDGAAFWLSSGNWQSSNLPEADPLSGTKEVKWIRDYNREWHAVVEHEGLAKIYEAFLQHDFENNRNNDPREAVAIPELLIPEGFFIPEAFERISSFDYFPPFDEDRDFTVTPLLTPDNYHAEILRLVSGARDELLIQNQTFKAPGENHAALKELLDAVLQKQEEGVRVRIIFRILRAADARKNLEGLQDFGFDTSNIRVQKNCHTKGIIVDRKKVLLGSQNWSNDGVSVNRDASLLFEDEPLASYFGNIFDHDWKNLAISNIGRETRPIEFAPADAVPPAGMVRVSFKEFLEMM